MTLNEYQRLAISTAIYPDIGENLIYPTLKLCGESGEVAEKVGKSIRDDVTFRNLILNSKCYRINVIIEIQHSGMLSHTIRINLDQV